MTPSLTSEDLLGIAAIIVLAAILLGLFLYLRTRLRRRRTQLLRELQDRPDLVQDRAFNRIAMARRESDVLAGQGTDVGRARELIAQAQGEFDTRHYDQAYQTAQRAHEALVNVRRDRGAARAPPAPLSGPLPSNPPGTAPAPAPATSAPAVPGLAKNRAESQFQLRLLDREIATGGPGAPDHVVAADLRVQAGRAFDRAEYSEAFRLALRGRRTLGGAVEALPPSPKTSTSTPPTRPDPGAEPPDGAEGTAAQAASAERCADCGYPALAGDTFCRGCGRPRTPPACPQCGAPRATIDTFCGRCGARFA